MHDRNFELTAMSQPRPDSRGSEDSVFAEGFQSPWPRSRDPAVPWQQVQELMSMAQDALLAKQRVAEVLQKELQNVKHENAAQQMAQTRAEADSGSLLEEVESLIDAKARVAHQREELDRANALLLAERELLCEQLEVPPSDANLVREVQGLLAAARRSRHLAAAVRRLLQQRQQLVGELEQAQLAAARQQAAWLTREQGYVQALTAAGLPLPEFPSGSASSSRPGSQAGYQTQPQQHTITSALWQQQLLAAAETTAVPDAATAAAACAACSDQGHLVCSAACSLSSAEAAAGSDHSGSEACCSEACRAGVPIANSAGAKGVDQGPSAALHTGAGGFSSCQDAAGGTQAEHWVPPTPPASMCAVPPPSSLASVGPTAAFLLPPPRMLRRSLSVDAGLDAAVDHSPLDVLLAPLLQLEPDGDLSELQDDSCEWFEEFSLLEGSWEKQGQLARCGLRAAAGSGGTDAPVQCGVCPSTGCS